MPSPTNPAMLHASMSLIHDGDLWTWDVSASVPGTNPETGQPTRVIRKAIGSNRNKDAARRDAMDALNVIINTDTTTITTTGA